MKRAAPMTNHVAIRKDADPRKRRSQVDTHSQVDKSALPHKSICDANIPFCPYCCINKGILPDWNIPPCPSCTQSNATHEQLIAANLYGSLCAMDDPTNFETERHTHALRFLSTLEYETSKLGN